MFVRRFQNLFLPWALLACACAADAAIFKGIVTHVSDGDTVWVRPAQGGRPQPVRLQGIDAPESCQAHGDKARAALAARLLHQSVTVDTRGRDDYRRTLARVTLANTDVGAWMVDHGHAWSYRFRSDGGPYERLEAKARLAQRGLWGAAQPMEPRQFRKRHGPCKPQRARARR